MLEFIRLVSITLETNEWFLFEIYVIFVWMSMLPRMLCAGIFFLTHKKRTEYSEEQVALNTTVILTIYKEELDILEKCMSGVKASLDYSCSQYSFLAIIDGWEAQDTQSEQYKVACKYADVVLGTDARNKRKNLRALVRHARQFDMLYDTIIFLDSDAIPQSRRTIQHLLRPFNDPNIGGTTTAQFIYRPETLIQRISFWLEDARLKSSMAACSLFNQIPCLPGRMYAVRTKLVEHRMDELVNDTFSYFGFMKRPCIAGDDRMITNFVLQAGYRTLLVPEAIVYTLAPNHFLKTCKMWARWGRSSQGYTLRSPWLIRYPMAFFVCWSDIVISIFTVYILTVHWPYKIITGSTEVVLWQSLIFSLLGMVLTMSLRQLPHLVKYPRDYWLLPMFSIIVTLAQFIRVWSLCTQHLIGNWGTREGADNTIVKTDDVHLLWQSP